MMLRRALDNLLSNAEKHGGKEQIALIAGVTAGGSPSRCTTAEPEFRPRT